MKTNKTLLRELRAELRYWQMQAATEARWLKMSRARAKEIGAKMRKLQAKPQKKSTVPGDCLAVTERRQAEISAKFAEFMAEATT